MGMFDSDRSGTITFNGKSAHFLVPPRPSHLDPVPTEFAGLWKYVAEWQEVFKFYDRDHSGTIEGRELAEALRGFGFNLSPTILRLVEAKYGVPPSQL
jgi:peflin